MLIRRGQILPDQTTSLRNSNPTCASGMFDHSITPLAHSTQKRCDVRSSTIGPRLSKALRFGKVKSFPIGTPHSKTWRMLDTRPSETTAERGVGPTESVRERQRGRQAAKECQRGRQATKGRQQAANGPFKVHTSIKSRRRAPKSAKEASQATKGHQRAPERPRLHSKTRGCSGPLDR